MREIGVRDRRPVRAGGGACPVPELRSLDAFHLAAALVLSATDLTLATWDRRLHAAARERGLRVLPDALSYASIFAGSRRLRIERSSTGAAWRARRRRSFQVMPSRTSAGMPIATAVAISTACRMIP